MFFSRGFCGARFAGHLKVTLPGILFAFSLSAGTLQAQEAQQSAAQIAMVLTQDQAVEMALRDSLSIESARISTETARRSSNLAWNKFIPSVDVGGRLMHFNNTPSTGMEGLLEALGQIPGFPPMASPEIPQWALAGSISASLSLNFAMIEDINRLKLDYQSGLVSYAKAKAQLERDVRKAYHNILLTQENVALLQGSLENADRQVQTARANFNAGLAPEINLLQAQVAMENLRPVVDQAQSGLRLAMMQFSLFLGLPPDSQYELAPVSADMSPLVLDTTALIRKATEGQPDVQELRQNILAMNSQLRSGRLQLFTPTLSLSWNAAPAFTGDPMKDSWFGDSDKWNDSSGSLSLTLGFRLNGLLPLGSESQGLQGLSDQIRIANIGLAQMIRGTEIEIYGSVLSLERIQMNTEAQQQTVELAQRSFTLTERAYRAGLVDFFQVQSAEQSLRQAMVQLQEQQFAYLNGILDLEYALGVPFGTLISAGGTVSGETQGASGNLNQ